MDNNRNTQILEKYIISVKKEKRNTAGAKAPADIAVICKQHGYTEFSMPRFPIEKSVLYQKLWLLLVSGYYWITLKQKIAKGSLIVYQHPMYGNRMAEKMIPWIQKRKGAKFIAIIHDLESLRGGISGVTKISKKTIKLSDNVLLRNFDAVICHNEHMRQYLISQGFHSDKLINLEIFDYLTNNSLKQEAKGITPSIAIAGNLAVGKCEYIYKLFDKNINADLIVNLYGINFELNKASSNMRYQGSFKPEELPGLLKGDFGLVWDGNSIETCAGNTGEYLKYNNPHKTSLYLVSGMPVIVWNKAAIADFVIENGVGIVVDSLNDLQKRIEMVTNEEYNEMLKCVRIIAERIQNGCYFIEALDKATEKLDIIPCGDNK